MEVVEVGQIADDDLVRARIELSDVTAAWKLQRDGETGINRAFEARSLWSGIAWYEKAAAAARTGRLQRRINSTYASTGRSVCNWHRRG